MQVQPHSYARRAVSSVARHDRRLAFVMPVHRLSHDTAFVIITNQTAQDRRLTWQARGLLAFMLSMPNKWQFNLTVLAKMSPGGRATTRTALEALEKYGYVHWDKPRSEDGKFISDLNVYESPDLNPNFRKKKKKG